MFVIMKKKIDKIGRGVFKAYLAKSKPATDAQQLALNFSAQNARYFNNLAAEDLKQIIDAGLLLKNCPFGLAALNATELRTVIAIFALMYEQTAANDALTTTEQPRGTFTAFVFKLADICKKGQFSKFRTADVCAAILTLENKVFFSADGKGTNKYFANPFLLKIDTQKTYNMPRKEYNTLKDAEQLARLKAAGQITIQINQIAYNKLQFNFTPIKREFFENLKDKAARKQIVCKTYVLFVFLSGLSDSYKIRFTATNSTTGKKTPYYVENRITLEHYFDITAATEYYNRHRKQRAADTLAALNFCKKADLLESYRITDDGFIYFKLNPKLMPKNPEKIKDYYTRQNAENKAAKLAVAV